jgi:hypothetical protein
VAGAALIGTSIGEVAAYMYGQDYAPYARTALGGLLGGGVGATVGFFGALMTMKDEKREECYPARTNASS